MLADTSHNKLGGTIFEFVDPTLGLFSVERSLSNQSKGVSKNNVVSTSEEVWLSLQLNPYESLNYRFWLDLRWTSPHLIFSTIRQVNGRLIVRSPATLTEPSVDQSKNSQSEARQAEELLRAWATELLQLKAEALKSRR